MGTGHGARSDNKEDKLNMKEGKWANRPKIFEPNSCRDEMFARRERTEVVKWLLPKYRVCSSGKRPN